jgi:uncharacterized protein (TIGR02147 family)
MKLAKPSIRDYQDYRKYLSDIYDFRKAQRVGFTFQHIARKTQTSRAYLKNVIDGRRHLSTGKIAAVAKVFGLENFEFDYLTILVLRDSTEDLTMRDRFGEILRGLRGALELVPKHFEKMQDEGGDFCLINTLGGTIYALSEVKGFRFERDWIYSQLINPTKYSLSEVEEAMAKLLQLGLIVEDSGTYRQGRQVSGVISPYTPKEAFRMYQPTAAKLYEVFDDIPAYGYIRVLSAKLSVGDSEMSQIEEEFARFKDRIEAISKSAQKPNRVLGFANTIFPLAHVKTDGA